MPTNEWGTYRTLIRKTVSDRETHPGLTMSAEIRQRTDKAFDVVLTITKSKAMKGSRISSRSTNLRGAISGSFDTAHSEPKSFPSQFTSVLEHEILEFFRGWSEIQKS